MNWRLIIAPVAAAHALALTTAIWWPDYFLLVLLVLLPLLFLGVAFLGAAILWFSAYRAGRSRRFASTLLIGTAVYGFLLTLALPCNYFIQQRRVSLAKEYPAKIAPLLEAYRQAHGRYPESLAPLPAKPPVPYLLRRTDCYQADPTRYRFSFAEPGLIIDTWTYDSETHAWSNST